MSEREDIEAIISGKMRVDAGAYEDAPVAPSPPPRKVHTVTLDATTLRKIRLAALTQPRVDEYGTKTFLKNEYGTDVQAAYRLGRDHGHSQGEWSMARRLVEALGFIPPVAREKP